MSTARHIKISNFEEGGFGGRAKFEILTKCVKTRSKMRRSFSETHVVPTFLKFFKQYFWTSKFLSENSNSAGRETNGSVGGSAGN